MTTFVGNDLVSGDELSLDGSAYQPSIMEIAPGASDLVSASQAPGESWMDTLTRILPSLVATYQQKEILKVQIARANAGLPPLDASQYGLGLTVGISPDIKNMLMIGGIALIAVIALRR